MKPPVLSPESRNHHQWWWHYIPLVLLGGLLRWHQFSALAVCGSDVGEYVYCVEHNQLPHSPYIGFLWIGYLLKPFIPLDMGYSLVSMVASLATLVLFGRFVSAMTHSRAAGWSSALALTLTPVAVRFGACQEVYSVLLFWLVCCWHAVWNLKKPFLAGLFMGCALITHSGVIFALPASLLLFIQAKDPDVLSGPRVRSTAGRTCALMRRILEILRSPTERERVAMAMESGCKRFYRSEERSLYQIIHALFEGICAGGRDFWHRQRNWALALIGLLVPVAIAGTWLLVVWIESNGLIGIFRIRHFLRGTAPGPDWDKAFGSDSLAYWAGQLRRIWEEASSPGAFGKWAPIAAIIGLLAAPLSRSLVWWLLPFFYLFYESTIGYSLDYGIYLVFLAPSIAWGIGAGAGALELKTGRISGGIRRMSCLLGLLSLLLLTPDFYRQGTSRQLYPWYRPTGANKALSDFVRQHSPHNSLVIQPIDWHFSGLAIAFYTDRIPLFRDAGTILLPGHWKPLFNHPKFGSFRHVTTDAFERWLSMDRPVISFDADPFHTWAADWPELDIERYEARPMLWLDRNQGGSSESWKGVQTLAQVETGNATSEQKAQFRYDKGASGALLELPLFRPTLYRIARKTDPPDPPPWAIEIQSHVPETQRVSPPTLQRLGIAVEAGREPISMVLPSMPGKDHALCLMIQSAGWDYAVECQIKRGESWVTVDRDMENIVGNSDRFFTELYFRVPSGYIAADRVSLRLLPAFDTPAVNAYGVAWGVHGG